MNSRKAQGLSMNVIIIAAIALVVLVVLIILVVNATNNVAGANDCEARGGVCVDKEYVYDDDWSNSPFEACQNYAKDPKNNIKELLTYSPGESCGVDTEVCCRKIG